MLPLKRVHVEIAAFGIVFPLCHADQIVKLKPFHRGYTMPYSSESKRVFLAQL